MGSGHDIAFADHEVCARKGTTASGQAREYSAGRS